MVLLVVIYIAFICLGLPDSLLGSAWPVLHHDLGIPISYAGFISVTISGGTVVSSLLSDRIIKRFGTGVVTLVSVAMTAAALLGFSVSHNLLALCLCAIPLGIGAGAVDSGLNNYVALHYKAKHMSWLHCFWGIGASLGPIVMSYSLVQWQSWNLGYRSIGFMQAALVVALIFSLPLWKKMTDTKGQTPIEEPQVLAKGQLLKLPRAKQALIAFFCYCAIETTVGLWGSSYLVTVREVAAETAASWIAMYYFGITFGRFLAGFLTMKFSHKTMVQFGQLLIGIGIIILCIPATSSLCIAGLFLIGLGCAPIFPSLLHETPSNFGSKYSQSMMGMQMACAYVGTTIVPPLFGIIGARIGYGVFPAFAGIFLAIMIAMVMGLYKK